MKTVALKAKLPLLAVAVLVGAILFPLARASAAPVTCAAGSAVCPYVKTTGSDLFTGGWFKSGDTCNTASYQSPEVQSSDPNKDYFGAVMTFGTQSRTGSSSNLGGFGLGLIEGNGASNYGFFTGPANYRDLSFSNVSGTWGGLFEGSASYANCIPNYYDKRNSLPTSPAGAINLGAANGNYTISGDTTLGGGTVNPSKNLAYFVNGDVYITGNVTYGSSTAPTAPKFVIVASGDIYINHSVNRLDGWYIAQPNSGSGGTIWTCRDGASGSTDDIWVKSNCGPPISQPLVVNGALTAKQVNLGRIAGGLFGANTAAETVNFTPEMVVGGGFFNTQNQGVGKIQSLVNLPPVY